MNKTGIQYLDYTWNPIAMRCTPVSAGCQNCWHLAMADRMVKNPTIISDIRASYAGDIGPRLIGYRLDEPLRKRTPSVIGLQFMGDLFHEDVLLDYARLIFNVMIAGNWHRYLLLTKRPSRMREFMCASPLQHLYETGQCDHIWPGVTVENQATADERIPLLLQTPAAHRWVSVEPMLGPVELHSTGTDNDVWDILSRTRWQPGSLTDIPSIDWIVAGCESGPRRRHADADWFRDLRDQCVAAGVPFFLKQMEIDGKVVHMPELDGQVWDQMPE